MSKRGRCEFNISEDTCDLCDLLLEGHKRKVVMLGPWVGKGAPKFVCQDCLDEANKALKNKGESA